MKTIISIPKNHTVLIVEDNDERIEQFRAMLGRNIVVAQTPQKALNVLGAHRFDIIFLDHDCINQFTDPAEPDYEQLSFWRVALLLSRTRYPGVVIIHSHNTVGAERMEKQLIESGVKAQRIRFGQFKIERT